jgi:glycosyltransferase involved in cell wall biosynthesis
MRILYAMPGWKPAYRLGGPIASVAAAAENLVRRGHEVIVAATNSNLDQDLDVPTDRPIDVDGVEVWYFRRREPLQKLLPFVPYVSRSMGFLYAPEMRRALAAIVPRVDVVDTQMPFIYPTYAVSRAALQAGKPLFYHQRGNFLETHLGRRRLKKQVYLSAFERPVMRQAAALIALTEAERRAFESISPGTPTVVVPNGVDLPRGDGDGARERIAARFGIPPDAPLILFLARLHPWKGADHLIEAFLRVARSHPSVVLVMAGADECDAETRWMPLARAAGLSDRLLFPGVIASGEKADFLERADLFCLPSDGEGLSMSILEAMAHRTAVMLTPACNFPEAAACGAGVEVEKDVARIAAAIERLIGDRDTLRRMGEAGRNLVARSYSWDSVTDRLVDVYSRAGR